MNCFEWHSRISDYLDGTLIGSQKREADEHLDSCKDCSERFRHYRQILETIAKQPRSALPIPIRKAPLSATAPRIESLNAIYAINKGASASKWTRTPWFIRTSAEGVGIAFFILLIIVLVPKVRSIYESSVERRLDAFSMADLNMESQASKDDPNHVPLARGKPSAEQEGEEAGDEFVSEDVQPDNGSEASLTEVSEEASPEGQQAEGNSATLKHATTQIRVGNSEIWRFSLKTDSPREVREQVVKMLVQLQVPPNTHGMGGTEAPGGIQFDMLVSKTIVPKIKEQLEKLVPPADPAQDHSRVINPSTKPFTWYKTKSNRAIPAGKTRVVIWLSQM